MLLQVWSYILSLYFVFSSCQAGLARPDHGAAAPLNARFTRKPDGGQRPRHELKARLNPSDGSSLPAGNGSTALTTSRYIFTLGTLSLTGNPTSLVIGVNTLTPGGIAATISNHVISIPVNPTNGQVIEDQTITTLGAPVATVPDAPQASSTPPVSLPTTSPISSALKGLSSDQPTSNSTSAPTGTGSSEPTATKSGSVTNTSLGFAPGISSVSSVEQSASFNLTTSSMATHSTGINSNFGTSSGSGSGSGVTSLEDSSTTSRATTGTNQAAATTSFSHSTYIVSNVPSGIPWGVMMTTISGKSYTLTWEGSKVPTPTTFVETDPSTTVTTSQTVGGFIWTLPSVPAGFPVPIPPGPPPGFPVPIIGGVIDSFVPGCVFGCGGGGTLPCLIDCGGDGSESNDPTGSNPDPSKNPSNRPSNNQNSASVSSASQTISSASSTKSSSTTSPSTSSSSSTGLVCDMSCGTCGGTAPTAQAKVKRHESLDLGGRRLADPKDFAHAADRSLKERGFIPEPSYSDFHGNMDLFITDQISYPGAKPCPLRRTGMGGSSAIVVAFDTPPEKTYFPSVSGLEGCTSVIIIGEKGCWISHLWESPSFLATDANFQSWVIDAIEQGTDQGPSPFSGGTGQRIPELADGDGEDNFKPEIFISTPVDDNGEYLFDARVGQIEQALTGAGRAFAGCTVRRRGYTKRRPDTRSAFGKVLIQYTNSDEDDLDEPLHCPQAAHYRVWLESELMDDHIWPASGNQLHGGAQKRQVVSSGGGAVCKISGSSSAPNLTSASASGIITSSNAVSVTGSVTSFSSIPATISPSITSNPSTVSFDIASALSASSASSASAASASADASWSLAAAVPSAQCYITGDDGFGDSSFEVFGINDWAGPEGDKLFDQENGCGILDPWYFYPNRQSEFQGRMRTTQTASFGLGFFKGGCVERAVHSAGGPSPDGGDYQIQRQHHGATSAKYKRAASNGTMGTGGLSEEYVIHVRRRKGNPRMGRG